jgi:hypothetical protein
MSIPKNEDIKTFENPQGNWEYKGAFSIELTLDADKTALPNATVQGNIVAVSNGRIQQSNGGIRFYSMEKHFHWGYRFIKIIRDGKGNLLWVNDNYR